MMILVMEIMIMEEGNRGVFMEVALLPWLMGLKMINRRKKMMKVAALADSL